MTSKIIVAYGANYEIGRNNDLLWPMGSMKNDMAHFRGETKGGTLIMGRKTLESMGNRPLPYRRNIVISRHALTVSGVELVSSIDEAFELADGDDPYVIGGGEIYRQTIDRVDEIVATEVMRGFEADTYFPALGTEWIERARTSYDADDNNLYAHDIVRYERS